MHVGIMGGTFDPIHHGHLLAAELAREAGQLDQIWFMPSYSPPHKKPGPQASPEERLEMVRLAVEGHPSFKVTDIEIKKGDTSYTVETVELLLERYPDLRFSYIVGADMVMYLPKWHRIGDLVSRIGFIGLERPGHSLELDELPVDIRSKVTIAPMLQIELSSTVIRNRLHAGQSVRFMVPEAVRLYMEEKRIYEEPQ
jgi:nicotinate-nucleotide adenylyltransferase